MISRKISLTVILVLMSSSSAWSSAWVPEPGHGYAKLWLKWLPGTGYHSGDGETINLGAYHELFLNAYGEVGIAPRVGLWLHAPIVNQFWLEDPIRDEVEHHVSIGDPTLGVRAQVIRSGRFALAADVAFRAPLADADPVQTVYREDGNQEAVAALRVGLGVWDIIGGISAGYGWDRAYVVLATRAIFRTGDFDTVFTWHAEGGGTVGKWGLRGRVTGWHPLGDGSAPYHETPSGIGNGTRYIGVAFEVDYAVTDRWWLGLSVEGGVAGVERQIGGPPISLFAATAF